MVPYLDKLGQSR